ncbi:Uncharacterised protein [Mycobacteroides abscessus subsp. abscessus]|nr:Uncharacterised protein [Mycobacteroides abscessus subsp. abscessus]
MYLEGGADRLERHRGKRNVGAYCLVGEDLLFDLPEPLAAVLLRPPHPEPPVAPHLSDHVPIGGAVALGEHGLCCRGVDQIGEILTQICTQLLLLRREVYEHRCASPADSV